MPAPPGASSASGCVELGVFILQGMLENVAEVDRARDELDGFPRSLSARFPRYSDF